MGIFEIGKISKLTGMKINKMIRYAELRKQGDSTVTERKEIMIEHLEYIEEKYEY
ncbi:hypothetical protein CLHOM_01380 [Clostridium homopropionicum DSM 5847]|uniref:MerR family transcriptional regulator n=1 Tax=Clostridium homopropionicum DSM 5847 TaxID=1121318 RepID=A0A0L6ZET6_9CLOT|nr:hypothetical protein [Clostridium homopropionicum]KOA21467.1 hypothetical protein CLHOM_01380 [Clostridium homopropionicum DSM 5847]SFG08779.1 hypothetical protein SAMN04488501_10586 [Clostridium homopropionicum]